MTQSRSNVIRLPPNFDSPSARYFFDAWCEIAGSALVPSSADFLDHAPIELMPYAFIHDIYPEGLMVRFMGTGLVQRWRHDLTGQFFGSYLDASERNRLVEIGTLIVNQPCGMRQLGRMASSLGRSVSFEAVFLPLQPEPGCASRMVVFSQILGDMADKEHSSDFERVGLKEWIDLGRSIPEHAPPI